MTNLLSSVLWPGTQSNRFLGNEVTFRNLSFNFCKSESTSVSLNKKRDFVAGGVTLPVNRRQKVFANGTLVIESVQKQPDAGTYTCQARNNKKLSDRRDVEVYIMGEEVVY